MEQYLSQRQLTACVCTIWLLLLCKQWNIQQQHCLVHLHLVLLKLLKGCFSQFWLRLPWRHHWAEQLLKVWVESNLITRKTVTSKALWGKPVKVQEFCPVSYHLYLRNWASQSTATLPWVWEWVWLHSREAEPCVSRAYERMESFFDLLGCDFARKLYSTLLLEKS